MEKIEYRFYDDHSLVVVSSISQEKEGWTRPHPVVRVAYSFDGSGTTEKSHSWVKEGHDLFSSEEIMAFLWRECGLPFWRALALGHALGFSLEDPREALERALQEVEGALVR